MSGRGPRSAGTHSRQTKIHSLSQPQPQPSRLPVKKVNKAKKQQGGQTRNTHGNHSSQTKSNPSAVNPQPSIVTYSPAFTCATPIEINSKEGPSSIIAPPSSDDGNSSNAVSHEDHGLSPNPDNPAGEHDDSHPGTNSPNTNSLLATPVSTTDPAFGNTTSPTHTRSDRPRLAHSYSDPHLPHHYAYRGYQLNGNFTHAAEISPLNANDLPSTCHGSQGQLPFDKKQSDHFLRFLESNPSAPWHMAFQQLKTMGGRMAQLDTIQESTDTLKTQMGQVLGRTQNLEEKAQRNDSEIEVLRQDISNLKQTISQQQETISQLQKGQESQKENINKLTLDTNQSLDTHKKILDQQLSKFKQDGGAHERNTEQQFSKVKQLMDKQEKKIEQLSSLRHKIKADTEQKISKHEQKAAYNALIEQASANRNNLVITGIDESESSSAAAQASQFFKDQLKLDNLRIKVAYRLGKPPNQGSSYSRPILVKFKNTPDRNAVWRKRKEIKQDNNGNSPRIQADLPKELRDDIYLMYRVVNAASTYEGLHTAEVKNYKVLLNGDEYTPKELEQLPEEIRPSTISTKYSDTTLVFFTKHTCLSNHFPSKFKINRQVFTSVEHFLAYNRAQISKDPALLQRATNITDPLEAKAILNILKNDHTQEWKDQAPNLALQGLRAKFSQNPCMADYLCSTQPLHLGEASKNSMWGTGIELDSPDALNQSKWIKSGNLLGKTLMKIRNEIVNKRGTPEV